MNTTTEQTIDELLDATYQILDHEPDRAMGMITRAHTDSLLLGYLEGVARSKLRLAQAAVFKGDYGMALEVGGQALSLYRDCVPAKEEELTLLRYMADSHFYLDDYNASLDYGRQSLALCDELSDGAAMAKVLHSLGNIHCRLHHYSEAFASYKKSLALKEKHGFGGVSVAQGLENIGIVFLELGEYDKAMEYLEKARRGFEEGQAHYQLCVNQLNTGVALGMLGRYDEGLALLGQVLVKCRGNSHAHLKVSALSNLSEVLIKKGDWEEALEYAAEGCLHCRESGLRNNTYARCMTAVFRCQLAQGGLGQALNIGRECFNLCKEIGAHALTPELLKGLMDAEERAGDEKRALAMARELFALQEEIAARKRDFNIYREQSRLELELKQREIKMTEQHNEQLQDLNKELRRLNKDLETFVDTVSHDLREPLRTINFFSGKIPTTRPLNQAELEYLRLIRGAGSRMSELIDSLLLYARSGNIPKSTEPVPLGRVLAVVENNMRSALAASGASIEYGTLPTISAHRILVAQLFQNIISNSIKYGRRGIPVVVSVSARLDGNMWHVIISDNGCGIPKSDLERVFLPFVQVGVDDGRGVGLGLSTCRRIVERYGGEIWADSKVGEGTDIHISLPINPV